MWGNLTAYDQILAHLALTSINKNYKLGNGNLKLKVTLNEQLEVLECMLLAGCSLCFYFSFRHWAKSKLIWHVQGSLKYLRIQERLRAVRGMRSFAGTLWRPNTPAPLIWTLLPSCASPWRAFMTQASTSVNIPTPPPWALQKPRIWGGICVPPSWRFFPAHLPLCLCSPDWACLLCFILWLLELVPKVDYAIKFREEEGNNTCWASHQSWCGCRKERLRGRKRLRVSKLTSTYIYDRTGQSPVWFFPQIFAIIAH